MRDESREDDWRQEADIIGGGTKTNREKDRAGRPTHVVGRD